MKKILFILTVLASTLVLFAISQGDTHQGFALCENCAIASAPDAPSHLTFLVLLLLTIFLLGAHILRHQKIGKKAILPISLGAGTILLIASGLTFAGAQDFAMFAKQIITIFSAIGVLSLFFLGAIDSQPKQPIILDDTWER